ncbi:EAL domain-containing protein [Nitratifractor sp.]
MLRSVLEERSRHFKLALRVGLPLLFFILVLLYAVFYRETPVALTVENVAIFSAMLFVIVYYLYFALDLSRRETLLDRVTEGYHYDAFLAKVHQMRPQTLAIVQLGNLSEINENFGVAQADHLLRELVDLLGEELLSVIDPDGFIGRKTGAELLIALQVDPELAEKALREFTERHREIDGTEVELGFAVIRNNIDDPDKALEQLQNLLVQSMSRNGENTGKVQDARDLSDGEQRVIEALEAGRIVLSFRPLLNLHTDRVEIYEIGVRMEASDGSRVAPREFLPVINRHRLGQRYDLLIVGKILTLSALVDPSIAFSFNLSPYSLRNESFLREMLERLSESGIEAQRLIVEIYERRRHHRMEEYLHSLKRIRRQGIRLCLDNFGADNASLEYLRHFSFDMIQFDREYTQELESEQHLSLLRSFVNMARETGIQTVAKWVDNSRKIETLRRIGIDYIQGYAAGKVLNEQELVRLYNSTQKG